MNTRRTRADTIFAPASGPGRAALSVIRISGPEADAALGALTRIDLPAPRLAVIRTVFDNTSADKIDQALIIRFPAPHSYTGEDVAEIHAHGGPAVVAALLAALGRVAGLRPAEPGEFTRRAVANGKLDLTQAEAIADLVAAETEAQRRQALHQLGGALETLYEGWRARLIRAAAWIEAALDFPDEEIPDDATAAARAELEALEDEIRQHLGDGRRGEILRDGLHVAVIGPPNAGKSALVNALAQRDVAIVSDIAGTTRDVIEVRLDLGGFPVVLADTAGLRESGDAVEREGVRRAKARAAQADLRLLVRDTTVPGGAMLAADLVVWNKADLRAPPADQPGQPVSARTGEGIEALIAALAGRARDMLSGEGAAITRARHRAGLAEAADALGAARGAAAPELAAEELRRALAAMGRLTGRVDLDEMLDVVFADFCIGK